MATGRSNQLTRQIGEHLVAAELGRRLGLFAAPFAGNVPAFDVLATDGSGRSVPIQVKAINGPSWQFDVRTFLDVDILDGVQHVRGPAQLTTPNLLCVFVFLRAPGSDEFFIFPMRTLQGHFLENYEGRKPPRNVQSFHCAVWPKELEEHKDKWDLILAALNSA